MPGPSVSAVAHEGVNHLAPAPKRLQTSPQLPAAGSLQEAFEALRRAVVRTQAEEMSARHPVLGKLTHEG